MPDLQFCRSYLLSYYKEIGAGIVYGECGLIEQQL